VKRKIKKQSEKKKRNNFVFTGEFGKLVATEMLELVIGCESSQIVIDKNSFVFWICAKSRQGDDNTTGKKQAHEMREVLLTILCYCMLQVH